MIEGQNDPLTLLRQQAKAATTGNRGSVLIKDATAHAGAFSVIEFVDDSVVDTILGNAAGVNGEAFSRFQRIYGVFTSVKLTSGRALLYTA